jgi:hypothetical protein
MSKDYYGGFNAAWQHFSRTIRKTDGLLISYRKLKFDIKGAMATKNNDYVYSKCKKISTLKALLTACKIKLK